MTKITPQNASEVIGRYLIPDVHPLILDFEKSKGTKLWDAKGQRFLLDCFTFVASDPLGHNHPKMYDPAFEKKLLRVARSKPANANFYSVEMAEFVDTFARIAMPEGFKHLFFIDGGTLAVENALKVAFDWKVRLNQRRGLRGELGSKVIHFRESFHGRSGYCISLTNTDPTKTKFFPKFDWPRITNPKIKFPLEGDNLTAVEELERKAVAEIEKAFEENPADIAAIIIEPIQGEGGDNHFRAEFLQRLRQMADEYEAMLIFDEVQTGVGLTGKMWAFEHFGATPDIIAFGKKMQVCGICVGSRVDEVANNVFVEHSRINSTWGGNLTDMVRAQRYLEIIEEEKLVENAAAVGKYLERGLMTLREKYPQLLSNERGRGLMWAIDVSSAKKRDELMDKTLENGLLILKCGANSLRIRPSLKFAKSDVDEFISLMDKSVKDCL